MRQSIELQLQNFHPDSGEHSPKFGTESYLEEKQSHTLDHSNGYKPTTRDFKLPGKSKDCQDDGYGDADLSKTSLSGLAHQTKRPNAIVGIHLAHNGSWSTKS